MPTIQMVTMCHNITLVDSLAASVYGSATFTLLLSENE
jgi:hypothetical protein